MIHIVPRIPQGLKFIFIVSQYLILDQIDCYALVILLSLPSPFLMSISGGLGSRQPMLVVTEPGTVWVDVTDMYDCHYVDSAAIVTDEACLIEQLYIPTVFSPNGDGINDICGINPDGGIDRAEIQIFDRWGNNLFTNTDRSLAWDGRSKGDKMVPTGVYVYLIKVQLASGSVYLRKGDVTLLR